MPRLPGLQLHRPEARRAVWQEGWCLAHKSCSALPARFMLCCDRFGSCCCARRATWRRMRGRAASLCGTGLSRLHSLYSARHHQALPEGGRWFLMALVAHAVQPELPEVTTTSCAPGTPSRPFGYAQVQYLFAFHRTFAAIQDSTASLGAKRGTCQEAS